MSSNETIETFRPAGVLSLYFYETASLFCVTILRLCRNFICQRGIFSFFFHSHCLSRTFSLSVWNYFRQLSYIMLEVQLINQTVFISQIKHASVLLSKIPRRYFLISPFFICSWFRQYLPWTKLSFHSLTCSNSSVLATVIFDVDKSLLITAPSLQQGLWSLGHRFVGGGERKGVDSSWMFVFLRMVSYMCKCQNNMCVCCFLQRLKY